MAIFLIFVLMFLLMFLGMDIFVSMAFAGAVYLFATGNGPIGVISNNMINGLSNMALLCIPFFILVGELMNIWGMTDRTLKFALFFIGRIRGALAHACIVINAIFRWSPGSAPADAVAISPILLPQNEEEGYDEDFSAALNAAAAILGPIIPPGIPMVFLALITNLSIGRLFLGAMIPGLIMAAGLHILVVVKIRKIKLVPRGDECSMTLEGFREVLRESFLSLLAPVIIIAGVISGIATITEIAILATGYVLFIGAFVYKTIRIDNMIEAFAKAVKFSATIMALFAVAGIFSYLIAVEGLGIALEKFFIGQNLSPYIFLLIVNIFFLLIGMVMDATPAMLIFVPLLLPIAVKMGIDPTHFGTIVICNLMIGLITPPVGGLLFIMTKLSRISFDRLVRASLPFVGALIASLVIITYVPWVVTYLPNLVFGGGQ